MTNLLHDTDSAPGRVRTFKENPEYGTTPHSCTLIKYNGNSVGLARFVTIALKGGAGVKVIFPADTEFDETVQSPQPFHCTIDRTHDDYDIVRRLDGFIEVDETRRDGSVYLQPLDTIVGTDGILDCLSEIDFYVGSPMVVDLSNLRPSKTINKSGMESSGPASFWDVFQSFHTHCELPSIESLLVCLGHLNNTMRRGGYKKGIVTSAMDYKCELINDYLDIDITTLRGSHKTGIIVDDDIIGMPELIDKIVEKRNTQSLFIEKRIDDVTWMNVCMAIALGDRATCLIWRVNLGLCKTPKDIVDAFVNGTKNLVNLHLTWRNSKSNPGIYTRLNDDRQVGLDLMGLANYLSLNGIQYVDFVDALERYTKNPDRSWKRKYEQPSELYDLPNPIFELIHAISNGYQLATKTADRAMADAGLLPLDRIFTIEPAQSHAYECLDTAGFTTCRGIFAPFGRLVDRTSDSEINRVYNHGSVETAGEIGSELQVRLCNAWQGLMNLTGRAHGISQDTYGLMDRQGFTDFMASSSKALYYAEHNNYNQRKYLSKTIAVCTMDDKDSCQSCGE